MKNNRLIIEFDPNMILTTSKDFWTRPKRKQGDKGKLSLQRKDGFKRTIESFRTKSIESAKNIVDKRRNILNASFKDQNNHLTYIVKDGKYTKP